MHAAFLSSIKNILYAMCAVPSERGIKMDLRILRFTATFKISDKKPREKPKVCKNCGVKTSSETLLAEIPAAYDGFTVNSWLRLNAAVRDCFASEWEQNMGSV